MRIPETRYTWPVQISLCRYFLWNGERGGGCTHGPCSQSWPWWKIGAMNYCALDLHKTSPCSGRRLWIYYRSGALHVDIVVDRRNLRLKRRLSLRSWLASKIDPIGRPQAR